MHASPASECHALLKYPGRNGLEYLVSGLGLTTVRVPGRPTEGKPAMYEYPEKAYGRTLLRPKKPIVKRYSPSIESQTANFFEATVGRRRDSAQSVKLLLVVDCAGSSSDSCWAKHGQRSVPTPRRSAAPLRKDRRNC
eukprot:scaffold37015_cov47-Prasinocladus_malaysianus.AAC.2